MRWLVADSLSTPEQWFCSHLSSYSHYIREMGEVVDTVCLTGVQAREATIQMWTAFPAADVVFALDRYDDVADWRNYGPLFDAKFIAQCAAITDPLPWEVRKADGSPAFDLVVSSIPYMVEQARVAGCRAEYQPLAFDLRARSAMMGVKREPRVIFIGTRSPAHPGRERVLAELGDLVEIVPPVFGREYFRTLASATVLVQPHLGWARGCANSMKTYEAPGVGTAVVYDGLQAHGGPPFGFACEPGNMSAWRGNIATALASAHFRELHEGEVLVNHTYEKRIPQLVEWARSL